MRLRKAVAIEHQAHDHLLAVGTLAGDSTRRAAMGAEGRRRAETEFAAERINEETLRVYERALALGG